MDHSRGFRSHDQLPRNFLSARKYVQRPRTSFETARRQQQRPTGTRPECPENNNIQVRDSGAGHTDLSVGTDRRHRQAVDVPSGSWWIADDQRTRLWPSGNFP